MDNLQDRTTERDQVREGAILRWDIHASSSTWRILYTLKWDYKS